MQFSAELEKMKSSTIKLSILLTQARLALILFLDIQKHLQALVQKPRAANE